jgi:hypothetical protein
MSSEKAASAEEMGDALWGMCGRFTDDFYTRFTPKLQAEGFLHDPAEHDVFAIEALQLHLWIISYVLRDDGGVLDVVHNLFAAWDTANCQGRVSQTVRKRFARYTRALHQDDETRAKGHLCR